jgi:hypothetical protein
METTERIKQHIIDELQRKLHVSADSDIEGIVNEVFRQKGPCSEQPMNERLQTMDEGYYWVRDNNEWLPARLLKRNGGITLHAFSYVSVKECVIDDTLLLGPRIFPPLV